MQRGYSTREQCGKDMLWSHAPRRRPRDRLRATWSGVGSETRLSRWREDLRYSERNSGRVELQGSLVHRDRRLKLAAGGAAIPDDLVLLRVEDEVMLDAW